MNPGCAEIERQAERGICPHAAADTVTGFEDDHADAFICQCAGISEASLQPSRSRARLRRRDRIHVPPNHLLAQHRPGVADIGRLIAPFTF